METYEYKGRSYGLWTETEVIEMDEDELVNSFMNIMIVVDDREIGLNVWTANFLQTQLNDFTQSPAQMLLTPDIIVKSLQIEHIKKAAEEYIDEMGL